MTVYADKLAALAMWDKCEVRVYSHHEVRNFIEALPSVKLRRVMEGDDHEDVNNSIAVSEEQFAAIADKKQNFVLCRDDNNFQAGDVVELREISKDGLSTGRKVVKTVLCVVDDADHMQPGHVVLGIG